MDVILTLGRLFYDAAHLVSILLTVFLIEPVEGVESLGGWAWGLSALWMALLLLDWTGRLNLHGSFGKLAAALILPAVLGSGELPFRGELFGRTFPLEVRLCFFLLALLLGSILLRGPSEDGDPVRRAELLLERGCELAVSEAVWLCILGGAVFLMATLGLLLVVIIGELMAQNGSLFDYGGMAGMLLGLLGIHLAQVLMFWRGLRLVEENCPEQVGGWSPVLLWIPVVNLIWAGRLRSRLWKQRMERENPAWNQL